MLSLQGLSARPRPRCVPAFARVCMACEYTWLVCACVRPISHVTQTRAHLQAHRHTHRRARARAHTHTHKHTNTHAHTHTLTHAHTRSHTLAHTGGQPYQPVRPLCCFPSATPLTCDEAPVEKPLCYSRCARRRACRISPATSPRDTRRRRSSAHVSMLHLARDVQRLRCCARREMLSGLGVIQVR